MCANLRLPKFIKQSGKTTQIIPQVNVASAGSHVATAFIALLIFVLDVAGRWCPAVTIT